MSYQILYCFCLHSYFHHSNPGPMTPCSAYHMGIVMFCCCCSVTKPCLTLCDPPDCSTPLSSVPYYLWVCSNSCLWSWLCCLTILSCAIPFSFCLQSSPASRMFIIPLFVMATNWKQLKCASVREFMQRLWYLHLSFMKNSKTLL